MEIENIKLAVIAKVIPIHSRISLAGSLAQSRLTQSKKVFVQGILFIFKIIIHHKIQKY